MGVSFIGGRNWETREITDKFYGIELYKVHPTTGNIQTNKFNGDRLIVSHHIILHWTTHLETFKPWPWNWQ
jgi:hypothetical protein